MKNSFLYFTRTERIGILSLMVVCCILWVAPRLLPDASDAPPTDFSELAQLLSNQQQDTDTHSDANPIAATSAPAPFDPNAATPALLAAAGVGERGIKSWMGYLSKGGQFRKPADVDRFRGLSEQEKEQLLRWLVFDSDPSTASFQKTTTPSTATPIYFDPNEVSKEQLVAMGVPPKVASNWQKFLQNGGSFKKATDIRKIYGMTDAVYDLLLPFAQMTTAPIAAANGIPNEAPSLYEATRKNIIIDINKATAEDWQQLRGIGPGYSKRIVSYRDKLGGFHSVEQVAETYGLPDSTFQAIYLQLRPSAIYRPLHINSADETTLAAHPYLNWNEARAIVNYRKQHGAFTNAESLSKLYALSAETRSKMAPYWVFD
ncbi:MAG: helix-hairpin-helix domain-containing protein [Saprospiraceae bacterium]